MNNQSILEAQSLKTVVKLSHICKTENGIENDEDFIITDIIGEFSQLKITNQYNQSIIINPNQLYA